jgi:uncharacterized protein YjiK
MPFTSFHFLFKDSFQVKFKLTVLLVLVLFVSFEDPNMGGEAAQDDVPLAYDVGAPDEKYKLPSSLEEISGLSYYKKDKLACVQDEKGNIYILNLEKGKITKKYDFGDDGDYEDIAVVGKKVYILKNNGNIYRIKDFKKKDPKVKKYNTPLKEKNDCEGMTHDPRTDALLIACKGSPSIDKDQPYEGYKAIYKFDLEEKELEKDPRYLIDLERLDNYKDRSAFAKLSVRIAKRLRLMESETSFEPSGIAIHPGTGEIYIISSVGKLLIILDRGGKVLDVIELDPELFRQPEGICFSPEGDMYISNEGQGKKGYVLKFKPQKRRE